MRVLIVNTSERTGGAAVAAGRLMDALCNNGVKAKMLVRDRQSDDPRVVSTGNGLWQRRHFLWERLCVWLHLHGKRQRLFEIDMANSGFDITRLPEFREADVIHLHWVNQGMLSLGSIGKILRSGKPVVWTMHDLWPATALCHYARDCKRYRHKCDHCPLLPGGGSGHDLADKVWRRKQAMIDNHSIFYVACSRWLEGEARKSALLQGQPICSIPNAIDMRVFQRKDRREARQRLGLPEEGRIILFVSQRVTDERKGIAYFIEALERLVALHPELSSDTSVAILGGHADEVAARLALPTHALGYVSDDRTIVDVYNAANVFVTPSLEDNLPNTIMEAMACGMPCVGFRVGGIPEMIDHQKNGYVAQLRDADDLARGMGWVLCETDAETLGSEALHKVGRCYAQTSVALRYSEIYQQAIAQKHFLL